MRVLVLGGTGRIGQRIARLLSGSERVSEVVVSGRNLILAERIANGIGGKAVPAKVDVFDESQLRLATAECDLVVNAAAPEFLVSEPSVRAAIRAGTHYCDVGADGRVTEKLLELDSQAKDGDVLALVGIGAEPGVTNLMMLHAARQLDEVDEIRCVIYFPLRDLLWADPRTLLAEIRKSGRVDAGWQTIMRWGAPQVRTYRDGHLVDVTPAENGIRVSLPRGPEVMAYPIGSAEPITLPRYLPRVRTVSILLAFSPPQLNHLFHETSGRMSAGELDPAKAAFSFLEIAASEPEKWLSIPQSLPTAFTQWATAIGRKRGRPASYTCWPSGPWYGSAASATAAALKILSGAIPIRGVVPPEACLDPMSFFAEAARYGTEQPKDGKLLRDSLEVEA